MKLGCNSVVLGTTDLKTALQHIAWAGYKYVELAAIAGMCEHVALDSDPQEVKGLLGEAGLEVTAMEAATNDRERLVGLFKLASQIGIGIVNIGSGGTTGDEASTVDAIERMRDFAKLAGDAGVKLAVKPHVGQAIHNAETGLRLMNEVDEPALGLNFDPSHLFRANETPQEVAHRWGDKIITSHFRDCPWREGSPGTPDQQIPGRGVVDIPATLAALKEVGYAGPLNLEVIGAGGWELSRAMGVVAESHGYLHRCLQEIGVE
jgi:sugar phosphate isomerase/epimerase